MNESQKTYDLATYMRSRGFWVLKVHGSEHMPPGTPDLLCCINGRFLAIEVKLVSRLPTRRDTTVIGPKLYSPVQQQAQIDIHNRGGAAVGVVYIVEHRKWVLHENVGYEVPLSGLESVEMAMDELVTNLEEVV